MPTPPQVLGTHVPPDPTSQRVSSPPQSYTYYHAGPLFSLSELHMNSLLSRAVKDHSSDKFIAVLPQDIEQRDISPHSIRDEDIRALLSCDLALFTYDGTELDSGTVVEYMVAKMADIPTVILRTDFRGSGDQGSAGDPWNLMSSFWPRTECVVVNGMVAYKTGLATVLEDGGKGSRAGLTAGEGMVEATAREVIAAFERVIEQPPRLPKELRDTVYHWLGLMPGFRDNTDQMNVQNMLQLCKEKETKGLL